MSAGKKERINCSWIVGWGTWAVGGVVLETQPD